MNDSSLPIASPRGYHDFVGLGQLRAHAGKDEGAAMRKVAEQFEAHFIQQMMQTMRAAVEKSDLVDTGSADMFQDMMDKEVSTQMASRSSMGLADMIMRQWEQRQAAERQPATGAAEPMPLQPAPSPLPLASGQSPAMALPTAAGKAYQLDGAPATVKEPRHE
jgi:flagellar protein FlgJ